MVHTLKSLQNDLEQAGINPTDTLLVHSSMKKIGQVDGGADTVIDAFMDFFGKHGLLVFPTLSYTLAHHYNPESTRCRTCADYPKNCFASQWLGRTPEFHVKTTPACVGLLPNLFMHRSEVVRSLHPTHSLSAFGTDARSFTAGHELSRSPCGKLTPWWKLYERHAKILHLGSELHNTTYLHGVDEWRRTPDNPQGWMEVQCDVYDEHEQKVTLPKQLNSSGSSRKFPCLEDAFIAAGGLSRHRIGDADAILLDCDIITRVALDALQQNPMLFS